MEREMGQTGTEKAQATLSELLAEDKETVMNRLLSDRAQEKALTALESEMDRLMYKAGAMEGSGAQSEVVQGMLQVVKSTLPLIESVSEAEVWEKESGHQSDRRRLPGPVSIVCLIAGIVCAVSGLVGQSIAGKVLRPDTLLWTIAGCVLLVIGGYLAGKGRKDPGAGKAGAGKEKQVRQTFLVDPAKVWHILQGITLSADHSLERVKDLDEVREQESNADSKAPMSKDELQFFCDLLENAYARRRRAPSDDTLREQVESIRYYLHSKGIETEDYSVQSVSWFELLPASGQAVTIRPALIKDGVVIRRGLASA